MTEKIVIEFDEGTGTALVKRPGAVEEYVVCHGYDPEAGDWGHGTYRDDLAHAVEEYYNSIGKRGAVETARPGQVCSIRWCEEDLRAYLAGYIGAEYDTPENVKKVKEAIRGGKALEDRSVEEGREIIDACVDRNLLAPKTPED